jgi:hypothetical protein
MRAVGGGPGGNGTNMPGIPNARTTGGVIGDYGGFTGAAPRPNSPGGASPGAIGQAPPSGSTAPPTSIKGVAEEAPPFTTGLARPGPDGASTVIIASRPCGVAAHETDGATRPA